MAWRSLLRTGSSSVSPANKLSDVEGWHPVANVLTHVGPSSCCAEGKVVLSRMLGPPGEIKPNLLNAIACMAVLPCLGPHSLG